MMIPDYSFVAEIMLYAAGFKQSSFLAEKLSNLFKLGSEEAALLKPSRIQHDLSYEAVIWDHHRHRS